MIKLRTPISCRASRAMRAAGMPVMALAGRRFRHAVAHAVQVIRQLLIAYAVAVQEGFILRAQLLDFVSQRQHQRHVGIRPDRDPPALTNPGQSSRIGLMLTTGVPFCASFAAKA